LDKNRAVNSVKETWQPLPHVAPVGFKNSLLFYLRLLCDFWVSVVYKDVKEFLKNTDNSVLEVGCGLKPYRHLVPEDVRYCGIDWEGAHSSFHYNSNDTIYYNGDVFPLPDESFDYLFHTEVLEHIYDLNGFLSECYRVLSKKGKMFFTIPFAARYHYIPYDYWRLTPSSIQKLLTSAGFINVIVNPKGSDIVVIIAKINVLLIRTIMCSIRNSVLRMINRAIFGLLFVIPWAFFTLIGHLLLFLKIGSVNDPLGYTVYCEKNLAR
jgi:SAM-dependent methyltransferase